MTLARVAQRALGLGRLLVLTHWLSPRDVGLVSIGLLCIETLSMLTVTGLASAYIQRKEAAEECLDAVWTVQVVRALILVLLAALLAPLIGRALGEAEAGGLIRALSLMLLFNAGASGAAFLLRRELDFGPLGIAQTLGAVVDVAVTLSLAYYTRSPWALVAGQLSQSAFNAVASYVLHPYRPRLDFRWGKLRRLWRVGAWMGASNMLLFASRRVDDLLVGFLAGPAALGVYQPAFRVANLPGTEGTDVLAGVFFPAYARMQGEPARARRIQRQVVLMVLGLTLPYAGLLILTGPWAVRAFFRPEWQGMAVILQLLAVQGLFAAVGETARPILFARGKPRLYAALKAAHVLVFIMLAVPLTLQQQAYGAGIATTITAALFAPVSLYAAWRVTRYNAPNGHRPGGGK